MIINYFTNEKLATRIYVDMKQRKITIKNFTNDLIDRAFGIKERPTWNDFEQFLESRCFPRTRDHMKWHLEELGLNHYEPLDIIRKTQGRMADDNKWIEIIE